MLMPRVLLCPPDFYGIEYEINPWMERTRVVDQARAYAQWQVLRQTLSELNCACEIMEPRPGWPDMVFTANAGLVVGKTFIGGRFRPKEREGETAFFREWFREQGYRVIRPPGDLFFEGEGDALFCGDVLFCGYRFRSEIRSHRWLGELLDCLVISAELIDSRFYHIDTCFCPLSAGCAIWFPSAFDAYGQSAIRQQIPDLIAVTPEEALRFACNAVVLGRDIVLPEACPELCATLRERGYRCHGIKMSEFIKAGGACKCLTLFVSRQGSSRSSEDAPEHSD
jgi:N-dimethylarginine dimethylaminohydrolase